MAIDARRSEDSVRSDGPAEIGRAMGRPSYIDFDDTDVTCSTRIRDAITMYRRRGGFRGKYSVRSVTVIARRRNGKARTGDRNSVHGAVILIYSNAGLRFFR